MLKGVRVSDYDLFSPDPQKVSEWLISNSIKKTFENDLVANYVWDRKKVQVIKKYTYGTMEETVAAFDFTCVSAAYNGERFVCHDRFYLDAAQSRLVLNKLQLPLSSIKRALKYAGRGYKLCPVALATICRAINEAEIDWNNPDQNMIEFYPDGTPSFRGID